MYMYIHVCMIMYVHMHVKCVNTCTRPVVCICALAQSTRPGVGMVDRCGYDMPTRRHSRTSLDDSKNIEASFSQISTDSLCL